MNLDRRLSSALHVLLHLAGRPVPVTSAELGQCLRANPVVVRRTLAGLRAAGLVRAEKGRGGGWSLGRDPAAITVRDVHDALGRPSLVVVGLQGGHPECRVERAVNVALGSALAEAEALLRERLAAIPLTQLTDTLLTRHANLARSE